MEVAHAAGAIVKVIFENAYLTDDEKVRACRLTEAAGGDFVKTSTGFAPCGATHEDLAPDAARTRPPHVQVKAAGGVRTLDALLAVMALGVTRIGATATETMILDFRARKAGRGAPSAARRDALASAAGEGVLSDGRARRRLATRHLGLDLGATNLKWAVVDHAGDLERRSPRGQVPTRRRGRRGEVPAGVTAQLAEVAVDGHRRRGARRQRRDRHPGPVRPGRRHDPLPGQPPGALGRPPGGGTGGGRGGGARLLINDARAFGLAELRLGAGRGASSMVGLTLGTGMGGVIAIDGRVHLGHDGTAGEIGHQTIDPDGPWCGCGNRGCLEAYARADQIAAACGTATAEEAVVRAARAGDARARAGIADVGRYLGIGIANMITVISPDRIVLGGGVAAAGDLLFGPIRAEIAPAGPHDLARCGRRSSRRSSGPGRGDRGRRPRRGAGAGSRRRAAPTATPGVEPHRELDDRSGR